MNVTYSEHSLSSTRTQIVLSVWEPKEPEVVIVLLIALASVVFTGCGTVDDNEISAPITRTRVQEPETEVPVQATENDNSSPPPSGALIKRDILRTQSRPLDL